MKLKHQSFFKITLFLVFVALVAAGFVLIPRMWVEMTNRTVAQAVRYQHCYELLKAADKASTDVREYCEKESHLLKEMRRSGINSIVLTDATLQGLARTGAINLKITDGVAIVSEIHSHIFDEVVEGAKRRYGDKVSVTGKSPKRKMYFRGNTKPVDWYNMKLPRAVQQLPLGIMTHELRKFYRQGFNLIVGPENFKGITKRDVDDYFLRLKGTNVPVYAMIPARYSSFGGTELADYVAERMERQFLVLQEHYTQLGFFPNVGQLELAEKRNYSVLRAYTIDYFEMSKLSYEDAVRRWDLADDERNIRLNIIHPILKGNDLIDTNLRYIKDITQRVENRGFRIGLAKPFETYFPNRILLIPIIAGILAAFMLLCQSIFGWGYGITVLCWGIVTGVGLLGNFISGTLTHQVMGVLAAVSFPVLSIYYVTDMLDDIDDVPLMQILANCVIGLFLAVCLSFCGACLLAAVLTDTRFFLEIDIYRGVKLTFLLPLLLILIIGFKKYDILGFRKCISAKDYFAQIKTLVCSLTWKKVMLSILFLAAAWGFLFVFLGRTGHNWNLPVPEFELEMRHMMEKYMYARPRIKEFLVGHVAFCLLILACHKAWPKFVKMFFVVVATIGQVSLVETFCHMRSPFLMSVARGAGGYILGLMVGILLVCIAVNICKLRDAGER